jgi:hypothetical protein
MARTMMFAVLALIALVSVSSAGCAATAYQQACRMCNFDAQGKMNQTCFQGYQTSGTACVSTSYPVAAAKYAAGQCPEIDKCTNTLQTCKASVTSGNDSQDCQEGLVAQCFQDADKCMAGAAVDCGDKNPCASAPAGVVLLGATFYYGKKKSD